MKKDLLFYEAYESFYKMSENSNAFRAFCRDAFGEDFSQDGFSDVNQVNMILPYIPHGDATKVLDIGCGNGKMLKYLQKKTNCSIFGFDYSANAIEAAKLDSTENAEFQEGIIGEIEYPEDFFDTIISMDTMYFAKDMQAFVGQIKRWLKRDGTIFVAYQEGDVMPNTQNKDSTVLAKAFKANNLEYAVTDITKQTYEMLKKKRLVAQKYREEFIKEGNKEWFDMLIGQTDCTAENYEHFSAEMARYIYIVKNGK